MGGGATAYSVNLTIGHLGLDAGQVPADQGEGGHRTQGGFTRLNGSLARQQAFGDNLSGYASWMVQRSSANLDSAEKLPLGGPTAVRAYPVGEASCDDAWLASVELRYQLPKFPGWQMFAFADVARGRVNHAPNPGDDGNDRRLSGLGMGTRWTYDNSFSIEAFAAWRTGTEPTSDTDRKPRLWMQAATFF
jgi:hemolysin activation/secretion protein